MYQQQQHPIDNLLAQHIHGTLPKTPRPTKSKPQIKPKIKRKKTHHSRFGYSYKANGEVIYGAGTETH